MSLHDGQCPKGVTFVLARQASYIQAYSTQLFAQPGPREWWSKWQCLLLRLGAGNAIPSPRRATTPLQLLAQRRSNLPPWGYSQCPPSHQPVIMEVNPFMRIQMGCIFITGLLQGNGTSTTTVVIPTTARGFMPAALLHARLRPQDGTHGLEVPIYHTESLSSEVLPRFQRLFLHWFQRLFLHWLQRLFLH